MPLSHYFLIAKLNLCRFNTDIKISQYIRLHIKNSTTQIAHYNSFQFYRYAPFRCGECLFTNIQKQKSTLKRSLLFKKNTSFTGK